MKCFFGVRIHKLLSCVGPVNILDTFPDARRRRNLLDGVLLAVIVRHRIMNELAMRSKSVVCRMSYVVGDPNTGWRVLCTRVERGRRLWQAGGQVRPASPAPSQLISSTLPESNLNLVIRRQCYNAWVQSTSALSHRDSVDMFTRPSPMAHDLRRIPPFGSFGSCAPATSHFPSPISMPCLCAVHSVRRQVVDRSWTCSSKCQESASLASDSDISLVGLWGRRLDARHATSV